MHENDETFWTESREKVKHVWTTNWDSPFFLRFLVPLLLTTYYIHNIDDDVVFSARTLERLNAIIYDQLPRELERRMATSPAPIIGIDAINLVESGLSKLCDRTLAVIAPAENRIRRIMVRDGIPEEYARLRVAAQKDDDFYRTHCTDVLVNTSATPEDFQAAALDFFRKIARQ